MAVITGDTGTVTFAGGYVTNVKSWTLNIVADEHDVTDFAATAWAAYLGGLKRWSGSYDCWLDSATVIVDGLAAAAAIVLTANTGQTFTGNAWITTNDVKVNPADPNQVTVNFRGSGALAIA